MPRPKRTRVAPSAPSTRVTKSTPTAKSTRKVAEPVAQQIDDISDVDETSRTRWKRVRASNALVATPATTRSRRTISGPSNTKALEGSKKTRNAISTHLETENLDSGSEKAVTISSAEVEHRLTSSSSPSIEMSRREAPPSVGGNSVLNVRNFRRRPREGSILGRGVARGRSSSVDSNFGAGAPMVNTPRIENSALAKGKFRRRAREPSILGGAVDRRLLSSPALDLDLDLDLESTGLASAVATPAQPQPGSALKFGSFRRRARQPSILGSAQGPHGNAFDLPDDDYFAPEGESTPLKNRAEVRASLQPPPPSSLSGRRKAADIEVPQSSPVESSETDIYGLETIPATASQKTRRESTPPREGEEVPEDGPETRLATSDAQNDTMAPPMSSSPMPSVETPPRGQSIRSVLPPAIGTRRQPPRNQPPSITATQGSPVSSPPPLTHSPNYKKLAAARKVKEPKRPDTYSTAQLQDLLPRRRRRQQRNEFDVPNSSDEVDTSGLRDSDDELSHLQVRTTRTPVVPSLASLKKKPAARPASKTTTPVTSGTKRTYASRRAASSDKENAAEGSDEEIGDSLAPIRDMESEESQELEKRLGRELKIMKRKFEDVDKWELDFEEVTASSSSPRDGR